MANQFEHDKSDEYLSNKTTYYILQGGAPVR